MARLRAVLEEVVRVIRAALEPLLAAARRLAAAIVPDIAALLGHPRPPVRPPARIDPSGGISAAPRGRPAFRPARTY